MVKRERNERRDGGGVDMKPIVKACIISWRTLSHKNSGALEVISSD